MHLSIKTNFPDIQRNLDSMRSDIADKAMASALNKTVAQAKTAMSREIRSEYVLSAATINQSLRVSKAVKRGGVLNLQASLQSVSQRGRSLNLAHFQARQTSKGVTFKVKRTGGRKLIPGAFLINNGRTVMIREGKKRLPIKSLQTINVSQMFNTTRINAKVIDLINDKLPTIFKNEARYFTDRFNAAR